MAKITTILAIESSCDETAAAVIIDGKIRSSIIASQAFKLHAQYGGVVPEVAAREHVTVIIPTIDLALKKARVTLGDIDYIAVTQGPGLATSLMVGIDTAKALGAALGIPVIPINHLEGHIYANFVRHRSQITDHRFPAVILTVSGGHTMLTLMSGHGQYKLLGETVDDAAGEAFDKTARMLGLSYPGGAKLSLLAKKGNPHAFEFPRPMINSQNLNFSFSGLKTAVLYKLNELHPTPSALYPDLAASIQQAIVDVLISKTERAIEKHHPKTIMLGGGVAANKLLRKRFKLLSINYNLSSSIPKLEYCTDNAAMIGLAAFYRLKYKHLPKARAFQADPNLTL